MNANQVAGYLQMKVREVLRLASRGHLPARKINGDFQFRKGQIDQWVEVRLSELCRARLAEIEQGVSAHHGMDHESPLVAPMIPDGGVVVPLPARTRDAAIRALVSAAEAAGMVFDRDNLLAEIRRRERLRPTASAPGVALPHPARPLPYDIAGSFVIVGLTPSGIPFGAPDGTLTRLFFLVCCKDERTHLHVLARISRMLDTPTTESLLASPDADALRRRLRLRELSLLGLSARADV